MQVRPNNGQPGFSILEMMLATIILLVGLVAIAQLVPASILLNFRSRTDSSELVFAQHELDQFLDQPLTVTSFTDALGNTCNLGDPTAPNTLLPDNTAVIFLNGQTAINFIEPAVAGYSFTTIPDPFGMSYEVRWAVIVTGNASSVYAKRFILGVRQAGGTGYFLPVTLDTKVSK
jgi:type II secretory pathway pseudopilin PulG